MTISVSRGSPVTPIREGWSIVAPVVNIVVAALADHERLASPRNHPLDPQWRVALAVTRQVREFANMVRLQRSRCATKFTGLPKETLNNFTALSPDRFHRFVDADPFIP